MLLLQKIQSLSPLKTHLIAGAIAALSLALKSVLNVYFYYALLIVAIFFGVWAIVKYFSKDF